MNNNKNTFAGQEEPRHPVRGGSNQARVRNHNARLILSLASRSGGMPKAEMARLTGLSAQTISVIVRELEAEGLLLRGAPQRGRVGQPSVPMALDPDGAFALGLSVGRRSVTMVLVDFTGKVRETRRRVHQYPDLSDTLSFALASASDLLGGLSSERRSRVAGLGIAVPDEIWNWTEILGVDDAAMADWREIDVAQALETGTGIKTVSQNDCTAACCAEYAFGAGGEIGDFAYFYVASFIGGGIVLNGALYPGPTGNAGAFGSMPVTLKDGTRKSLLGSASLFLMEDMLTEEGRDPSAIWLSPDVWPDFGAAEERWIAMAANYIAQAISSVCSTIDFPTIVIDGAFPPAMRTRLVDATRKALEAEDMRGLYRPRLLPGTIGPAARAVGGAALALVSDYFLDRNALTLS